MEAAGLRDREKSSGGALASAATSAKTDLAPLDASAETALGAVIGGLDTIMFEESKQPSGVFEKRSRQVPDLAVRVVQMRLRQDEQPFL